MSLNEAIPYFYAAGAQGMTGLSHYIASKFTKFRTDRALMEPMVYQPIGDGGCIPEGTFRGLAITKELSPDTVLDTGRRYRDVGTIATGVIFAIAPIGVTLATNPNASKVAILVLAGAAVLFISCYLGWNAWHHRRQLTPGFIATNIAVILLTLVNVGIGIYFLTQPAPACTP